MNNTEAFADFCTKFKEFQEMQSTAFMVVDSQYLQMSAATQSLDQSAREVNILNIL